MSRTDTIPTMLHDATIAAADLGRTAWDTARVRAADAATTVGATTSHDKVKGGIIGGAAGAILGGVIGNNVDKKKKTVPIP